MARQGTAQISKKGRIPEILSVQKKNEALSGIVDWQLWILFMACTKTAKQANNCCKKYHVLPLFSPLELIPNART
ncbi:hypothetical protein L3V65_09370 [Heyndrickxia coagulans]|uniref:Uncharacterized protein n=1 Tax=Heyndrickxia coagulans TaxID=1398 RepID=A0A150KKE7_HEYCO|nr:hypothetical protein [Heyndrickxia coagulans]KYC73827.1 hypothetical protein B4099_2788 [Heyndrickxia coagulans]UJZ86534.1 hypothetical protein L3V65_09370 [Heyndrickxia coagulans]